MKIHLAPQGSAEWLAARSKVPTASDFDQIVTPEFKIRTGQMPLTYLARKLAESWLGGPLPGFNSLDMEFGKILEEEGRPFYSLTTGEGVQTVGLITNDSGTVGCSPDGLIGEDCGLEIKCPAPQTHVNYLLNGQLPKDYAAQVHGAMFVTGRPRWKFMSYCRKFPAFILEVKRDETIQEILAEALADFLSRLDEGMARLTELNEGPPRRRAFEQS